MIIYSNKNNENIEGMGLNFEKAPFKFLTDYLEVLGGADSPLFKKFRKFFYK